MLEGWYQPPLLHYNFLLNVYEKVKQWGKALKTSLFKSKMMDLCHKMQNTGEKDIVHC